MARDTSQTQNSYLGEAAAAGAGGGAAIADEGAAAADDLAFEMAAAFPAAFACRLQR